MTSFVRQHIPFGQSELSLSLSTLLFTGGLVALLGVTFFPPQNGAPWLVIIIVAIAAFVSAIGTLIAGSRLTSLWAGILSCLYIVALLMINFTSITSTRGLVSGLLIVSMIIFFVWFLPLWFARISAYVFLGVFTASMLLNHPGSDTGLIATVVCALTFVLIEVFGRLKRNLFNGSLIDHLCQVWNRAGLSNMLKREIRVYARNGAPLSMLYIDLDGFKDVNDQRGHHAGDLVLQGVAQSLVHRVRPTDTVARIGGDEFVVLLPDTTADQARLLADRLRSDERVCEWSYGVAEYQPGETATVFMNRSDTELLAWKRAKRLSGGGSKLGA